MLFPRNVASTVLVLARAATSLSFVPRYVLDYGKSKAICMNCFNESFYPYDIGEFLRHTQPYDDKAALIAAPGTGLTLDNLDMLNGAGPNDGLNHYLTSIDVTTKIPLWAYGVGPDESGKTDWLHSAAIILNDKGNGNLDAFYFYFYAWHDGRSINGHRLGIHVGDWEHTMVGFKDGEPEAVWFSQYGKGVAYSYDSLDKYGLRPVVFSASGSHALYPTAMQAGIGDIPTFDNTSQGVSWDPLWKSYYIEVHSGADEDVSFTALENPYNEQLHTPTAWLDYRGHWGDAQLPLSDSNQEEAFNDFKWVAGPRGPRFEQLNRERVCKGEPGDLCEVRSSIYNHKEEEARNRMAMMAIGDSSVIERRSRIGR